MSVLALNLRVTACLSLLYTTKIILSGITMPNLEASFRALRVLHTARDLFKQYGFHKVGVDRIIAESKITKATFYNYFHSKERLIEMCLTFQKDGLKKKYFLLFIHTVNLWYLISSRKSFSACQPRRAVPFTFTGHF